MNNHLQAKFHAEVEQQDWWRLNRRKDNEVFEIEWCPKGVLRVKSDSRSIWIYKGCQNAKFALSLGLGMIEKHREELESIPY